CLFFLLVRLQDELSSAPKRTRLRPRVPPRADLCLRQDQVIRGERHLLCAQRRKFDDNKASGGTCDYSFTKN
ncbi:MAG: hypothetical protein WA636_08325, partial [Methylovirgula sp.]